MSLSRALIVVREDFAVSPYVTQLIVPYPHPCQARPNTYDPALLRQGIVRRPMELATSTVSQYPRRSTVANRIPGVARSPSPGLASARVRVPQWRRSPAQARDVSPAARNSHCPAPVSDQPHVGAVDPNRAGIP